MKTTFAALIALGLSTSAALAHVTLAVPEAPQGKSYKAVLGVGHGCEGKTTRKVRVQIPEGVISVKPMPKAGWTIDIVKGPYEKPYDYYGSKLTEGVKEISWTGELPDAYFDEFAFRGYLTDSLPVGETVFFPVVQECDGDAAERWIEIPAKGQDAHDMESPAAGLKILPPVPAAH